MMCTNLQILNAWSFFYFSQLIGNITISGNYRVRQILYAWTFLVLQPEKSFGVSVVYPPTDLVYTSP